MSDRLTDSTLQMARNIPHLALIPLVIVWFGIDEAAKLFLVALGVFFPIYANTLHGVRSVDPQLVEMAKSYGMRPLELFRRVILPGALPSIFVGLRYALGIMWLTLIVAETIAAQSGVGYMAMQAREFMQIDVVVLSILDLRAARQARRRDRARARARLPRLAPGPARRLTLMTPAEAASLRAAPPSARRPRRSRCAASSRRSATRRCCAGSTFDVAAGAVRRHRRPQRLRQEHAAAADRRARRARRRRDRLRRRGADRRSRA